MICGAVMWAVVRVVGVNEQGEELQETMSEWLNWTLANRRMRSLLATRYKNLKLINSGVATAIPNLGRAL